MIAFLLTCLLVEITPGPNMATLAALTLARGRVAGFAAVAGVALGLAVIGVAAAFGLTALIMASPVLFETLRYAGAAFLLYLAYETWRGDGEEDGLDGDARRSLSGLFLRGFVTNVLNPKAGLFYVAILPAFLPHGADAPLAQNLTLVAIYVAVATVVHAGIVALAAQVKPWLEASVGVGIVRKALALGLVAVAVWLFVETGRG